ncbi:hypothetical protein AYO44_04855 [Planctomycetaceae bacterium SCGC AG-212-F19]|nr:hypothetical protein AYO44_04855 [Planctomycetaceae bacterium SCGC AG-212-F19]
MGAQFCCAIHGSGTVQFTAAEIHELRRRPFHGCEQAHRTASLKHVDPQTLAALLAVERSAHASGLDLDRMTDWGVIAAPRTPGRATISGALEKFGREGAWSVSPHLVPHCSLHSPSGTISQFWHMQGPNLGVGGFPGNEAHALLVAAAMLAEGSVSGLWVVWTGWQPEPVPGASENEAVCRAAALALVPAAAEGKENLLHLTARPERSGTPACIEAPPAFSLEALHARLTASPAPSGIWRWSLGADRLLELAWDCWAKESAA